MYRPPDYFLDFFTVAKEMYVNCYCDDTTDCWCECHWKGPNANWFSGLRDDWWDHGVHQSEGHLKTRRLYRLGGYASSLGLSPLEFWHWGGWGPTKFQDEMFNYLGGGGGGGGGENRNK